MGSGARGPEKSYHYTNTKKQNTNTMCITTTVTATATKSTTVRFLYRNEFKWSSYFGKHSFKYKHFKINLGNTGIRGALVLPLVLSTLCTLPIYNYKRRITDTKNTKDTCAVVQHGLQIYNWRYIFAKKTLIKKDTFTNTKNTLTNTKYKNEYIC